MAFNEKYMEQLSSSDINQYRHKLTLANGDLLPCPYTLKDCWKSDVVAWPLVGWPDIYSYIIERPSTYTKSSLKAYR